jgi:hypothetical protein
MNPINRYAMSMVANPFRPAASFQARVFFSNARVRRQPELFADQMEWPNDVRGSATDVQREEILSPRASALVP